MIRERELQWKGKGEKMDRVKTLERKGKGRGFYLLKLDKSGIQM